MKVTNAIIPGTEGDGVKVSRNAANIALATNEQNFVRELQNYARGYQITGGGKGGSKSL